MCIKDSTNVPLITRATANKPYAILKKTSMKPQQRNAITLAGLAVLCMVLSGCNPLSADKEPDEVNERQFLVDNFVIKFSEAIILMETPSDTVGVESFSEKAGNLQTYFSSMDEKVMISRYFPDFDPADTLRVTAAGDTIRQSNWALVFKFNLSTFVSFPELEEKAEKEPLIEWVDPPYEIDLF